MSRVAVIGLGTMGGRVAGKLAVAGHSVSGYDPSRPARDRVESDGVSTYDDETSAISDAGLIVLSLPRPEHVIGVAEGALTKAKPGSIVVDLSTIDPGSARTASSLLSQHGIVYVDAPVLGRPQNCGQWTLPAGGAEGAIETVRGVLEGVVAKTVVRVGDVGAGSVIKVLNNLMFGAINAVTVEVLNTCRLAGVDPETFVTTVADSGAATVSNLFRELGPKLVENDYEPAFSLALLSKDNKLAIDLEGQVGAPSFMASCVDQINTLAMNQGLGARDTGAIQEFYRSITRSDAA